MIKDINGIMMTRFKEAKRPLARQRTFVNNVTDHMQICECLASFLRRLVKRVRCFGPKIKLSSELDAADRCVLLLEHLRMWEEDGHGLRILEPVKMRFIEPKFRTGQVVEASWNGFSHRVKILRQYDLDSFEVRMLDGDPYANGKFNRITSSNMRRIALRIKSYRYVNVHQFEDLGFELDGNEVCSVDFNGYAHRKGIVFLNYTYVFLVP